MQTEQQFDDLADQSVGGLARAGAVDGDVRRATSATTTGWPTPPRPAARPRRRRCGRISTRSPRSIATPSTRAARSRPTSCEAICDRSLARIEHRLDLLDVANHMNGAVVDCSGRSRPCSGPTRPSAWTGSRRACAPSRHTSQRSIELLREGVAKSVTAPRVVAERTRRPARSAARARARGLARRPPRVEGDARDRLAAGASPRRSSRRLTAFREAIATTTCPATTETIGISALPDGDGDVRAPRSSGGPRCRSTRARSTSAGSSGSPRSTRSAHGVAAELGYPDARAAIAAHTASGANTRHDARAARRAGRGSGARSWDARARATSAGCPRPTARCGAWRRSARRTSRWPSTTRRPTTARGAGIYYINCYDLPDRALHHVASVTYHEANPGHHFQLALQQEMPERPPLRRFGVDAGGRRVRRGVGPVLRAPRRRDGAVPRRLGAARDAREPGSPRRAARHRLGDPRARLDPRGRRSTTLVESGQTQTDSVIEVDRYIGHAGPGAVLHDRDVRDPARARVESRRGSARRSRCRTSTTACWRWARCRCRRSARIFGARAERSAAGSRADQEQVLEDPALPEQLRLRGASSRAPRAARAPRPRRRPVERAAHDVRNAGPITRVAHERSATSTKPAGAHRVRDLRRASRPRADRMPQSRSIATPASASRGVVGHPAHRDVAERQHAAGPQHAERLGEERRRATGNGTPPRR